jgi:hypothetical protein
VALPHTVVSHAPGGVVELTRPAEAWLTRLVVHSSAPLTGITLDDRTLDMGGTRPNEYTFLIFGRDDAVRLQLATEGEGEFEVEILDRLHTDLLALAAEAGLDIPPRPAWMMVAPAADTADSALVTTHVKWSSGN